MKLNIDIDIVNFCHSLSNNISENINDQLKVYSTTSTERALLRLLGVNGCHENGYPIVNKIVEILDDKNVLKDGVCHCLERVSHARNCSWLESVDMILDGEIEINDLQHPSPIQVKERSIVFFHNIISSIRSKHSERIRARRTMSASDKTLFYVLTATGSALEDVSHARAVANAGGDIIAVIRSTAQSLLDYVPPGLTTEGYGGTFATLENFRHMRQAMDNWTAENGRYIQVSSFCSGLCMPEIAALGATEGFDNMVNDALYGILYRDINPIRTLIDQYMSRSINGCFDVTINTGEDNYLRTADPISAAPSVVASQFINFHLAKKSGLKPFQIGIGNACEISPETTNGLLLEWAQALLTKHLFPDCPTKYMPPTKHMSGDLYRTHTCDVLFNLITIATRQGIQTIGVPTEGIFTPLIQDRVHGLNATTLTANYARDLSDEIQFTSGGIVQSHAKKVLNEARDLLINIDSIGLLGAIEAGVFGDVSRCRENGRGRDGVFEKSDRYVNGFIDAYQRFQENELTNSEVRKAS